MRHSKVDGRPVARFLCRRSVVLLFLAGLTLLMPHPAQADTWENVTLVSISGLEYVNVTVKVTPEELFVLVFNAEGEQKKISRSNIHLILDARGKDITRKVLAGVKAEEGDRATSSATEIDDRVARSMSAFREERRALSRPYGPRFRALFNFGSGYGVSMGDWYEGLTSGVAFDVGVRLAITEKVYLGATYCYQKLGVESYLENIEVYDELGTYATIGVDWDVHVSETFFVMGVMTDPYTEKTPIGYLETGLGAMNHVFDLTVSEESIGSVSDSTDETDLGWVVAGGGVFPLGRTVGLHIAANIITVSGDAGPYSESVFGTLFGIRAGLSVMLGGT
jgi:hypothetical protein